MVQEERKVAVKVEVKAEVAEEDRHVKKSKNKKKKEKGQGPVHITANGDPLPLDSSQDLDQSHPLWKEVSF